MDQNKGKSSLFEKMHSTNNGGGDNNLKKSYASGPYAKLADDVGN